MKDLTIEFKSLSLKVKSMLKEIKKVGIDTTDYEREYEHIINDIASKKVAVSELNNLKNKLFTYESYFKIKNTCDYIETKLQSEITDTELKKFIDEITSIFSNLNLDEYDNTIVEKLYEIGYELIKLELLRGKQSTIYERTKNNEIDRAMFSECIAKEIDRLNLKDEKYKAVKIALLEIKKESLLNDYYDINLIESILMSTRTEDYSKELRRRILSVSRELKTINDRILEKYDTYTASNKSYKNAKKVTNEIKETVSYRAKRAYIAAFLYLVTFISSAKLGKALDSKDIYLEHRSSYSEEYGFDENERKIEVYNDIFTPINLEDKVYLRQFGEYTNDSIESKTYDVTGYEFDTLVEYLESNIAKMTEITETFIDDPNSENYQPRNRENYTEIDKYEYEFIKTKTTLLSTGLTMFFGIFITLMWTMVFSMSTLEFPVDCIKKYIEYLNKLKDSKKTEKEKLEELQAIISDLKIEVSKSEELKNKLNEIIKNNKFIFETELDPTIPEANLGKEYETIKERILKL